MLRRRWQSCALHTVLLLAVTSVLLLPLVASTPAFFRVQGSSRRFYCLPQGYETEVAEGFNSVADNPKTAVLLELLHGCGEEEQPFGSLKPKSKEVAETVDGNIAILFLSNCTFSSYQEIYRDATSRVATAREFGAVGIIFIVPHAGMPVPLIPGTLTNPTCLMDLENGNALFRALDGVDKSVNVIITPENMPLDIGDDGASGLELTGISVTGVFSLEAPLPAWPALFMEVDSLSSTEVSGGHVLARMSKVCTVTDEGSGEYEQCVKCWKAESESTSNVFENGDAFSGAIVLFYSQTQSEKRSQRCYRDLFQLALLAEELGAAGVLFGMSAETKRPTFPKPTRIPGMLRIPTFSILNPHAIALALATDPENGVGVSGVEVTFPGYDVLEGFPAYLAGEAKSAPSTSISFEVQKKRGATQNINCTAGQALFNPESWDPLITEAFIARPTGTCTFHNGVGCFLGPKSTTNVFGKHVKLAVDAGASALVLVNFNNEVFTLVGATSKPSPIPVFNVPRVCGTRMVGAAQLEADPGEGRSVPPIKTDGLSLSIRLPGGINGLATHVPEDRSNLKPLSLVREEFVIRYRQELRLSTLGFKVINDGATLDQSHTQSGQAVFNPFFRRSFEGPVVLAKPIDACQDVNADASTSCAACTASLRKIEPISDSDSLTQSIVLLRDTFRQCTAERDMVNFLEKEGALGVVVINDGDYFRTMVDADRGHTDRITRQGIPAFNVMKVLGDKFIDFIEEGSAITLSVPTISQGKAENCPSGSCLPPEPRPWPRLRTRGADDKKESKESGLSTGAKIGIVIICTFVGTLVIVGLVVLLVRWRRKTRYEAFETQLPEVPNRGGDDNAL